MGGHGAPGIFPMRSVAAIPSPCHACHLVDVSAIVRSVSGCAAVLVAPRVCGVSLSTWWDHTRSDPGCRPPVLPGTDPTAPPVSAWLAVVRVKPHHSAPRLGS